MDQLNRRCGGKWGFVLALAGVLAAGGCAPAFKSPQLSEIRYTPGKTSIKELVEQAGLPSRIEPVELEGEALRRFIYLRGSDQVHLMIPVAAPVGGHAYMGGIVKDEYSTYRPTPDVAFACLVSKADIVVTCISGDRR